MTARSETFSRFFKPSIMGSQFTTFQAMLLGLATGDAIMRDLSRGRSFCSLAALILLLALPTCGGDKQSAHAGDAEDLEGAEIGVPALGASRRLRHSGVWAVAVGVPRLRRVRRWRDLQRR